MPVVSFRLSDEDEGRLRRLGVNPGPRARDLLLDELREEETLAGLDRLEARSRPPSRPLPEVLRDLREER